MVAIVTMTTAMTTAVGYDTIIISTLALESMFFISHFISFVPVRTVMFLIFIPV